MSFSLLLLVVTLAGCKKGLTAKDVGVIFVNRLIYEDDDPRFEKNFVEGSSLDEELQNQRVDLTKKLVRSLNEFGSVLSEAQTEKLLVIWLDKVQRETSFDVSRVDFDKKSKVAEVSFDILGIDFELIYKNTMDRLVERMLADSKLAKNNAKLGDVMIALLSEEMTKATAIATPVTVQLNLKQDKKSWQLIAEKQEEELANILLAFLVGTPDLEAYSEAIGSAVTTAMDDALKKIEAELTTQEEKEKQNETEATKEADKKKKGDQKTRESSTTDSQTLETIETLETYADETK